MDAGIDPKEASKAVGFDTSDTHNPPQVIWIGNRWKNMGVVSLTEQGLNTVMYRPKRDGSHRDPAVSLIFLSGTGALWSHGGSCVAPVNFAISTRHSHFFSTVRDNNPNWVPAYAISVDMVNHGAAIIRPDQSLSEKMQELTEVVKLPMPEGRKKVIVARSSSGFHVGTWVLCDGLPLSDPLLILSEQSKQHTLPNGPALSPPA